ncbi:MAG TPA: 5'-nucleotidase C-terminal domain-containing protein [Bacteroidia bacterium]|nr:5'-nucleotidase C-terminal domain-containing protein [Bacteroidia bacterium]
MPKKNSGIIKERKNENLKYSYSIFIIAVILLFLFWITGQFQWDPETEFSKILIAKLPLLFLFLAIISLVIIAIFNINKIREKENNTNDDDSSEKKKTNDKRWRIIFLVISCILFGFVFLFYCNCLNLNSANDDDKITVTFLQINDVYEISPLDNGTVGGLGRVAALKRELCKSNHNTYTVVCGDFLSPSAIGTAKDITGKKIDGRQLSYEKDSWKLIDSLGEKIDGRQMVDVLNSLGVDLVTFGNHEFDLKEKDLKDRINQSCFKWVSTNVMNASSCCRFTQKENNENVPIPETRILPFKDSDGTEIKIGIFGVTVNSTVTDYVIYEDYYKSAGRAIMELENKCDFIVALTHLNRDEDKLMAKRFPQVKLIMGGHDHTNSIDTIRATDNGMNYVTKADANVKTVYVHSLEYNKRTKELTITSKLDTITNDKKYEEDADIRARAGKWNTLATKYWIKEDSLNPPCLILGKDSTIMYDGTEKSVRFKQTNLTRDIAKAVFEAVNKFPGKSESIDAFIYNSGSIRIDDSIKNIIRVYDIIRTLPYDSKIVTRKMKGWLLDSLLNVSKGHPGNGCFLQQYGISTNVDSSLWMINNQAIQPDTLYTIAMTDYLAAGRQEHMYFLKNSPDFEIINRGMEVKMRRSVIEYMKNKFEKPSSSSDEKAIVPCY